MTEPTTIKEVFQLLNQCPTFRLKEAVEEIMEHIDEFEEDENDFYSISFSYLIFQYIQKDLIRGIIYSIPLHQYEKLSVKTKDKMHLILKSYHFCNVVSQS
jgi:hypothetical protein